MSKIHHIYLLQNQDKLFLGRHNEWVDGRDLTCLFKTRHKDEALNELFEVNSKEISQRIRVLECECAKNGQPIIDPAIMPPPIPRVEREQDSAGEDELTAALGNSVASERSDTAGNTTLDNNGEPSHSEPELERAASAD